MTHDEHVVLLGEDIGVFGGSYRVTEGLWEMFGESRVRDTPISEIAIVGAAMAPAMTGLLPVAEIQFNDFLACTMDQLCNQAAKLRFMMGGQVSVPMVSARPTAPLGGPPSTASRSRPGLCTRRGSRSVIPSTPYDAKGLLKTAIHDGNPVVFLEHKLLYGSKSPGGKAETAVGEMNEVFRPAPGGIHRPLRRRRHKARRDRRDGRGHGLYGSPGGSGRRGIGEGRGERRGDRSADLRAARYGRDSHVGGEDLAIGRRQRRRAHVRHDGRDCGAGVAERGSIFLRCTIRRVCVPDTPIPFAPVMEAAVIPQVNAIIDAIRSTLNP